MKDTPEPWSIFDQLSVDEVSEVIDFMVNEMDFFYDSRGGPGPEVSKTWTSYIVTAQ